MATFKAQIQSLSGTVTDSEINQWMNDGAREVINILPPHLKQYCYSKQTFTSNAANSEAETMITGQLGSVYAGSVECRQIRPMDKHKASSSSSIEYASATDPIYYIEGNKINILPASSSGVYYVIANPNITASDVSAIDNFPNEAEYLVVLYAAIKVLQNKMNEMSTVSAIDTTAIGLVKTAVDQAAVAAEKFESATESIFGDEDTFDTAASQLTRVKDALNNAEKIIDDGANSPTGNAAGDAASYLYTEEDLELLQGALGIAQSEIQRAQAHIAEWVAIGDMRVKEVNAALAEANGYVSEVKIRMERESQKYQWYQAQQVKLQQDYDKGVQMLVAQGIPKPAQREAK